MKFGFGILPQRKHSKEQRSFILSYQDVTIHATQCNQNSLMARAGATRAKGSSAHPPYLLRPVRSHLLWGMSSFSAVHFTHSLSFQCQNYFGCISFQRTYLPAFQSRVSSVQFWPAPSESGWKIGTDLVNSFPWVSPSRTQVSRPVPSLNKTEMSVNSKS